MKLIVLAAVALWGVAAAGAEKPIANPPPAPAVPMERVAVLAEQIRAVAGEGVRVSQSGTVIRCALELRVAVPSSFAATAELRTFAVTAEAVPYLDDVTQRARLAATAKAERAAWRGVAALVCDGKEFSDHYLDGLCFRTRTAAQARKVSAYREAREALLAVPRHHAGNQFAVVLRIEDGEPTDGRCGSACDELQARVAALLIAYPASTTPP